jgi:CTP:molybdopterin cytidylyltransferase MocA
VISAIVLAAGEGRRFGGTKQAEVVRGRSLVQHAVDAAAGAGLGEIVVVLGHDAERVRAALELPPGARAVVNERFAEGQASSLAVGLGALDPMSEGAVVLLADQPGITAEHVRALVRMREFRRSPAIRLRFRNGPGPALLARELWPKILELAGDVGARALLDAHPELVDEVHLDEDAPTDVDERSDLERA